MSGGTVLVVLTAGIAFGTPLVLASVGEILSERSGVLNLGIEGMMLVGAVSAFWVTWVTGGAVVGVVGGVAAGAALGLAFAVAAVSLRVDQVVLGLAVWIFGIGLSTYIGVAGEPPLAGTRARATLRPVLSGWPTDLPVVGPLLFGHDAIVYLSWALVAGASYYLFHTRRGLALRAVGDDPASADAMGISVLATRYLHVVVGAACAGLAGAYVSLRLIPAWVDNLTAGLGWIAIALVVVAGWRPWRALVASYVFGAISRLGFSMQIAGVRIPAEFLGVMPYVLAIVVLVLVTASRRRSESPESLALPYVREQLT